MSILNRDDKRFIALRQGLNQLNSRQLKKILEFHKKGGKILCDNFNYDKNLNLWCPLAIGLDVEKKIFPSYLLSNEFAKNEIIKEGKKYNKSFNLNPLKGISGTFFRQNRVEDLLATCNHILVNRKSSSFDKIA